MVYPYYGTQRGYFGVEPLDFTLGLVSAVVHTKYLLEYIGRLRQGSRRPGRRLNPPAPAATSFFISYFHSHEWSADVPFNLQPEVAGMRQIPAAEYQDTRADSGQQTGTAVIASF